MCDGRSGPNREMIGARLLVKIKSANTAVGQTQSASFQKVAGVSWDRNHGVSRASHPPPPFERFSSYKIGWRGIDDISGDNNSDRTP